MTNALNLQDFLPYRCTRMAERISVSLSRIYSEQFGVSIAEWRILANLAQYGEMQAKQIGELTSMDKVRVSRAVASLAGRDLLLRRPCERDSRASNLRLTAAGRRLYRRIVPRVLAWENDLLGPLSANERTTLFRIIDKLDIRLDDM